MQTHPDPDDRQAEAAVGEALVAEQRLITNGPISSSPSATAPANAAIARIVIRIARWNSSADSRASRPARWGRIEVWIAWKSCSGARTISMTLKTKPARPDVIEPPAWRRRSARRRSSASARRA